GLAQRWPSAWIQVGQEIGMYSVLLRSSNFFLKKIQIHTGVDCIHIFLVHKSATPGSTKVICYVGAPIAYVMHASLLTSSVVTSPVSLGQDSHPSLLVPGP